jgi:hypothetical protein
MYSPPSEKDWNYAWDFDEEYADAYAEGYKAAKAGKEWKDNPYKQSFHERDMTHADELNFWWDVGFDDFDFKI